jgi:hypothetical protein
MQWSFSLNNFGVCLSLQSWRWCLRCCSVVVSSKGTHKVEQNLSASSQAVWVWATGSRGALLVSPFNVKWRFSVLAGGVEVSKVCLFLVVLPARCVSSVSPRFHYRRHAFCFLPLTAILEFSLHSDYTFADSPFVKCSINYANLSMPSLSWWDPDWYRWALNFQVIRIQWNKPNKMWLNMIQSVSLWLMQALSVISDNHSELQSSENHRNAGVPVCGILIITSIY